jgi:hypothetical protein
MTGIDVEGFFWADNPESRVRGHLTFDGRVSLALESTLRLVKDASRDKLGVIYGTTLLGQPLCLSDCFVYEQIIGNVQHRQSWSANKLLVGTHDPEPEVIGVSVTIQDFSLLWGAPDVDLKKGQRDGRESLDIEWLSRGQLSLTVGELTLEIDDDYEVRGNGAHLELDSAPRIRFKLKDPGPVEPLNQAVGPLLVLANVFLRRPVALLEQHVELPDGSEVHELFAQRPIHQEGGKPQQPWVPLGNLQPLDHSLTRWYEFAAELPSAFAMVAEYTRAGPTTPWEDRLSYLARFVEQYHRKRYDSSRMSKQQFKQKRALVKSTLHAAKLEELASWTHSLTEHANEKRLAERLQELVEDLGDTAAPVLPNPETWAKAVADTRNYYTHYSDYLQSQAAHEFDLVIMTKQLWWVVRACLLREMGFDNARSIELFSFDSEQAWLVNQQRHAADHESEEIEATSETAG